MADTERPGSAGESARGPDRSAGVTRLFWAAIVVCAVLAPLDFFYHKHAELGFNGSFGFYGWYGFVCCGLAGLAARELGRLLKRDEDYYDR